MRLNSIITGVFVSIIVFGGGYLLSKVIWKYVDGGYIHGIGFSHLFLLLLFLFCIGWTVVAFRRIKKHQLRKFWIGLSISNLCFICIPLLLLFIDFFRNSDKEVDVPQQSITIFKDSLGGVVVNQDGDTLIYRKGDSTLIDKTKEIDYETLKPNEK
jgi:hypothetical protein